MKPVPFFICLFVVAVASLCVPMSQAEDFVEPCTIKGGECSGGTVANCVRSANFVEFTYTSCCEDLDGDGVKHVTGGKYNKYKMTQSCPVPNPPNPMSPPAYREWDCYTRTDIQAVVIGGENVECHTIY